MYLEMRFSKTLRQIITLAFLAKVILILPVIIFIPSLALSQVTGINIHLINGLVCGICVFYTLLGGIKAVVWTDVVQAGIMLASCILIICVGVSKAGGVAEVFSKAAAGNRLDFFNMKFDLTTRSTFWNNLFGGFVLWGTYVGLNQSCIQRLVSVPTKSHARWAITLFCIGFAVIMSLSCFTGLVMHAYYYNCDPIKIKYVAKADRLLPFFVQDVLGHMKGVPGIFISSVFSAGLSTMSASLNSLAGIIYEDYIRKYKLINHTEQKGNFTMKALTAVLGIYCVLMGAVVSKFGHILQSVFTISGIVGGAMMGAFLLGMLWPWANKTGALYGTVSSIVILVWIVVCGQIAIAKGELKYPTLPTNIDGCERNGFNFTNLEMTDPLNITTILSTLDDSFSIGKISYMWYTVIGLLITLFVGVVVSYLTGSVALKDIRVSLIAPPAQWLLPKDLLKMQLALSDEDRILQSARDGKNSLQPNRELVWVADKEEHNL